MHLAYNVHRINFRRFVVAADVIIGQGERVAFSKDRIPCNCESPYVGIAFAHGTVGEPGAVVLVVVVIDAVAIFVVHHFAELCPAMAVGALCIEVDGAAIVERIAGARYIHVRGQAEVHAGEAREHRHAVVMNDVHVEESTEFLDVGVAIEADGIGTIL